MSIDTLKKHRSIRKYLSRSIEPEVMQQLIECGCRASNTGNMQLYSIIVTQEPELKSKLTALHFGQGNSAPAILTICVDINRYHHWCRMRGCDEPYSNLLWLLYGTIDASLCAQNICVAAESLGLGFCYLGTVLYNTAAIAELLQLPKGVVPVITLSIGYPDEQPEQSERLPEAGIVHQETYHDYSDADIDHIHEIRESFPFNQEMVRINGMRNLAELFTQKRYPKTDNIAISKALAEFLDNNFFSE